MNDIPIYNIDVMLKDNSLNYNKLYPKIENCGNIFMKDEKIKNYLDENIYQNKKLLFPFLKYIVKRKDLVHNLIPIYDNSYYSKYNYNAICLLPNYFQDNPYDKRVLNTIIKINEIISDEIRF